MREYAPLTHTRLPPQAQLVEPRAPGRVTLDDPAIAVMTDLRDVRAATVAASDTMERAHAFMIRRGVRLLFVLDRGGTLAGAITATDVLGEKPMRFLQSRAITHAEILVSDVMTPAAELEAVSLKEVTQMRVGHVVSTHRAVARQHIMVADEGGRRVCGLFSASQVARQLGLELQTSEVAQTFADIEAALAR
jgi:CBS domain-containing protein